jgi:hypothetical protein
MIKTIVFSAVAVILISDVAGAAGPAPASAGEPANAPAQIVKYKAGKDLNFEQLVIEGELKRPELSVVTGDSDENGNGLLRLRENFMDRLAEGAGEDVQ